jgi:hypothetical protein
MAFVGIPSTSEWREVTFDLSSYVGDTISIAWYFGSSSINTEAGWYIDDISVKHTDYSMIVLETNNNQKENPINLRCTPNPFNSEATIQFELSENSIISAKIYDIKGEIVEVLSPTQRIPAGKHTLTWRPENICSGLYRCVIKSNENKFNSSNILYLR